MMGWIQNPNHTVCSSPKAHSGLTFSAFEDSLFKKTEREDSSEKNLFQFCPLIHIPIDWIIHSWKRKTI